LSNCACIGPCDAGWLLYRWRVVVTQADATAYNFITRKPSVRRAKYFGADISAIKRIATCRMPIMYNRTAQPLWLVRRRVHNFVWYWCDACYRILFYTFISGAAFSSDLGVRIQNKHNICTIQSTASTTRILDK